eukprot:CAMPEP_0196573640 /NCGR_PEP_ID=MMETSP1081-20130531/3508_1 /TAXON_ID=36882 /ORGANISM="Pyramimonas amylifera, Strain CCMP720" /LENGTH=209 /DNA_ID=CAMNT_0041891421 /DNA_START=129 /DNA_END=754 /DNA_ORIENTATION=-
MEPALAAFQPLRMRLLHAPLHTALDPSQACEALKALEPQTLMICERDYSYMASLPPDQRPPMGTDALVTFSPPIDLMLGAPVRIPLPLLTQQAALSAELAQTVELEEVCGLRVARVGARLDLRDGQWEVQELSSRDSFFKGKQTLESRSLVWGQPLVEPLQEELNSQGFDKIIIAKKDNKKRNEDESEVVLQVFLGNEDGRISLKANMT